MSKRYHIPEPLTLIHPRSLKHLSFELQSLVRGRLWLKIMIGMFLGIIVGLVLGPSTGLVNQTVSYTIGEWLALPGYIFLALLQMIVVPLVFASIIRGIASGEDIEQLKLIGLRTVAYFLATTAIAILIGLTLALIINPGSYISSELVQSTMGSEITQVNEISTTTPGIADVPGMVTNILPTNPLGSLVTGQMLEVVVFSVIIGLALVSISPAQSKPLLDLLGSLQEVSMTIVRWSMLLAPFAVFGLISKFTLNLGVAALMGMLVYVGTVLLGLLLLLVFYLLVVFIVSRRGPIDFMKSVREVLLLAFSTSSSAVVMPLSIKTAEDKLGVRPSISQFVIPLGATINMNGTALYQSIAAVFLAQVFGVELSFGALLLLMVTVVGASIGTPSTPGVGIVILALILSNVGVPTAGIALIIGVDRILDMCRTSVNVTGDLVTCVIMDKWVGGKKPAMQERFEHSKRETERKVLGEDVLVNSHDA
ncbi:dicarboxylate/amino acid:cation symporter [Methanococcoides alaskense]|uniref:Na+/H+-dicarboxylate symporter n=1 Tax=Methanococcoides alaskense TaxID=325778 RepID=A0AA90ZA10_9EURY|nr:dicarboxylate/amino acid:cation symporter [Methanococcoides alaskense]MDA0524305.1 dicarboxylate/amino acid:cation symporter [Methanococcoides alaskense]MDR6223744.1 Na+/H+-dicarboxylate symporter [Methanococcoides alaskense]